MLLNCPRNKKEIAKTGTTNDAANTQPYDRAAPERPESASKDRSFSGKDELRFGRAGLLGVQRLPDRTDIAERELFARKLGL